MPDIKKVVVLGAGTMGAQVAAHLAGAGLEVVLLDIVPPGADDRSALARKALEGLKRLKPSPLHLPEDAGRIRPGNFEDHWKELKDADWVFEAVVEDLEIKKVDMRDTYREDSAPMLAMSGGRSDQPRPPPTPCTARAAIRTSLLAASPQTSEATLKTATPATRMAATGTST
jgi:2-polyprenyl-6-methoxyphenol hydroxylase-like FAD-dependent oxidoreductase